MHSFSRFHTFKKNSFENDKLHSIDKNEIAMTYAAILTKYEGIPFEP